MMARAQFVGVLAIFVGGLKIAALSHADDV